MKIPFACPSCGVTGTVDAASVGRSARCKQCKYQFTIRAPGDREPEVYGLNEPPAKPSEPSAAEPFQNETFVPSRGRDSNSVPGSSRPRHSGSRPARKRRDDGPGIAWGTWLTRSAVALVIGLVLIWGFVPNGTAIAGCVLLAVGSGLLVVGYGAGAYGAFSEDIIHGVLYIVVPFYTAYYIVTRWDDMWIWFACSTGGAVLVSVGTAMIGPVSANRVTP